MASTHQSTNQLKWTSNSSIICFITFAKRKRKGGGGGPLSQLVVKCTSEKTNFFMEKIFFHQMNISKKTIHEIGLQLPELGCTKKQAFSRQDIFRFFCCCKKLRYKVLLCLRVYVCIRVYGGQWGSFSRYNDFNDITSCVGIKAS